MLRPPAKSDVGRSLSDLTYEDLRSWHLNAAALSKAAADWDRAAELIRSNLDRMEQAGTTSAVYIERLRELLSQGQDTMRAVFLSLTDEGQVLRSVHPFAGLLSQAERLEIIRQTARPTAIE